MKGFRKNYIVLVLFVLLGFAACKKNKTVKVPEGIVVPDTMAQVLADVHILQASLQMGFGRNPQDSSSKGSFELVWKKHHLSEDEYNKSLKYYIDNPKLLDSVYDKVLNNLSQQKAELMGNKNK
jgi:hypothetical protein